MCKISICLLAIGDEHIKESLNLINSIKRIIKYNFNYYVGTDKPEMFIGENIITKKITENFNYNLKRVPIEMGLEHGSTIIFLDSDNVAINDIDFEQLEKVDDGCYGTIYHDKLVNVDNNSYYEKLHNFSKNKYIPHFFEHQIMIKLSDIQKRKRFIDNWELIYNETKDVQIHSKGRHGSEEGLIIGLSCVLSDINIIDIVIKNETIQYFNVFHHYCEELDKTKYIKYI
jgi:hypothetical protein